MLRNVTLEDVKLAVEEGELLAVVRNLNSEKYPHQRMLVVNIKNYAYLVPFVEEDEYVFLKASIPNRKATKIYHRDRNAL